MRVFERLSLKIVFVGDVNLEEEFSHGRLLVIDADGQDDKTELLVEQ